MNCPNEAEIDLFVKGELGDVALSLFEAHLDDCDQCLGRIADVARSVESRDREPSARTDSVLVELIAALARRSDRATFVQPVQREWFGAYRVQGVLGRGAMGIVYRAVDGETGQQVAVKTVAAPSPRLLSAIRQEIAFLAGHHHPGVVSVIQSGIVDGDPWYAMELLEGTTLDELIRSSWTGLSPVSPLASRDEARERVSGGGSGGRDAAAGRLNEVLELFARICDPLGFVHREGIVHCDLKPANIFLRDELRPVLMDFGLLSRARGAVGREILEIGGHLRGTLPYLAPELIRGQIPDARADLYSLGCILYECVTGRPPFVGKTAYEYLEAHLRAEPKPASARVGGVPAKLDELLASLLAKRASDRAGSTDAVSEVLVGLIRGSPLRSPTSVPSAPYLFRPRIVGRSELLDRIGVLRSDAALGRGRLVLLKGESGIGKTFLGSEIAKRGAQAGFTVVTGECIPVAPADGGDPEVVGAALAPFRNLLQYAADRCRDGGHAEALRLFGSERTIRLLARYEPALAHLLPDTDAEPPAPLPPTAERERMLHAMLELLQRLAADGPLLVIVDDVQWADDLSLALLDLFAERSSRDFDCLLLLAFYRSEEVSKSLVNLESKPRVECLRLDALDTSSLRVLVDDMLSDNPPQEFVDALAAHSEGNPFFVAEYLRTAAAEGLLERTTGGWRLAKGPAATPRRYRELSLPPSLHALLERRLEALSPSARYLTEAAAVLGRQFLESMLIEVAGPSGELQAAIAELSDRQVLHRSSHESLRFLHDKTREAAYARIEPRRRATLHALAARAIEAEYAGGDELPTHYAELAYHLRRAGDAARAVDYFEKAGKEALRSSANADAVHLLDEAGRLAETEGVPVGRVRRASWERMAGDALHGLGDLDASKLHLLKAVALSGWPMPEHPLHIGVAVASRLGRQILHRAVPRSWLAVEARHGDPLLEAARAYDRLQQVYYHRGEYSRLVLANLTTLNLSERTAPSSHLATAYANAGATAGIIPLRRAAANYFALAESTLAKAYDPDVEVYMRQLHAVYLLGMGQWEAACKEAHRSLRLSEDLGARRRWEENAGVLCIATSDLDERLEWASRALESARLRDDPQMTSWNLLRQAEVHAARGEFAGAAAAVAEVEAMKPRLGMLEEMWILATRSYVSLATGRTKEAESAADRASDVAKRTGPAFVGLIEAYTRIGEVQVALWTPRARRRPDARERRARAACASLAASARLFPIAVPSHCLCEGTLRWKSGDTKRAVETWQRGLLHARSLNVPYRELQLLRQLAEHLPSEPVGRDAAVSATHLEKQLGIQDDSPLSSSRRAHVAA